MLTSASNCKFSHSSNLVFMRRRQAANLLLSLTDSNGHCHQTRNLLLDALHQLPTEIFIADDWHLILEQVLDSLLTMSSDRQSIPTHLSVLLFNIKNRLERQKH